MDRDFQPYSPGSQGEPNRYATPTAAPPTEVTGPVETGQPGSEPAHGHHGGGHWMHLLMCAPMLLVVGYLVLTGKAGGGAILYAVGCLAMMGAMMAMMNHGPDDHSSGHRH